MLSLVPLSVIAKLQLPGAPGPHVNFRGGMAKIRGSVTHLGGPTLPLVGQ